MKADNKEKTVATQSNQITAGYRAVLGRGKEGGVGGGVERVRQRGKRLGIKERTQSDSVRNRDRKGRRQRKIY